MLHGRRLDHALDHVNGSRYALVHAVAKRARQITLWLTADPAELRAESAPPPVAGETVTRDPVVLAETEILDGEVVVRWDPDGVAEDTPVPEADLEADPLLIEGLDGDDDDDDLDVDGDTLTPALAKALDPDEADADSDDDGDDEDEDGSDDDDESVADEDEDVSLEALAEEEAEEDDDEDDN